MIATAPLPPSLVEVLQRAFAHHQAGRFAEAEQLYRVILQAQPDQPEANHNLGILACRAGQVLDGLPYLKTALAAKPSERQYVLSYAEALLVSGQAGEALATLKAAMQRGLNSQEIRSLRKKAEAALRGNHATHQQLPQAEHAQLVTLFNAGRHAELESRARQLAEQYPDSGFVWSVLGATLGILGKDDLHALQMAAALLPDDPTAHSNLGNTLKRLGRFDEAARSCRRALEIKSDHADARLHLCMSLRGLGQLDNAVANYQLLLKIKPDDTEAHNNLGNILEELGQLEEAVASYRRALAIKPDFAEAHSNLGNALKDLGQLDEAVACFHRALAIKPDYAEAHNNLGIALRELGQLEEAIASYRRALTIKPDYFDVHSNLQFAHNYLVDQSAVMLLAEARHFNDLVVQKARPYSDWTNAPDAERRLRVGFVSGDLRSHPVGFFIEGVLAALAENMPHSLEIFAYSNHPRSDELSERIKACCHVLHPVAGISDEHLAQQIREDGIDILIDLSGHTSHNRLPMFAWKPAPVQVTWLGYFATTGIAAIDYLIADPWTLPETEEANITETIWRLPETRLCFTPPDVDVPVAPLPAFTNGYVTFGCFNNLTKMNSSVVTLWARVLATVPDSRLFLKCKQLNDDSVRQNTLERFAVHGIQADRLILEGTSPRADYLAAYHRVDIALDPFPFTGGTTSAEGLWMGVPMLTLAGENFVSRQGVGLLMNAGLPEWIAADADDYVARALAHASDLQRLADLRRELRQQVLASPIFDAPRFARNFETALRGMWIQWCKRRSFL